MRLIVLFFTTNYSFFMRIFKHKILKLKKMREKNYVEIEFFKSIYAEGDNDKITSAFCNPIYFDIFLSYVITNYFSKIIFAILTGMHTKYQLN